MKARVVRHAEMGDAEALQALFRDILQLPHPPLKIWRERITDPRPGSHNLVACFNGKVVGQLTLLIEQSARCSHVATFGISVDISYRSQGVATALVANRVDLGDNWLHIERIKLTVFSTMSQRKAGFEVEGTGKRCGLRESKLVDACFMARIKAWPSPEEEGRKHNSVTRG